VSVVLAGLVTGFSLLVAIGAQNAYLLRLGLSRWHVGMAVTICASADVVLICLGVGGIGGVIRTVPAALTVLRWVGVAYLVGYALFSFWRARRPEVLLPSDMPAPSRRTVALSVLAFTFLNPHVYLDTVLLLGSIGNQYGPDRWWFALGAGCASIIWFTALGFGARAGATIMSRPATWRVLDVAIGVVMLAVALNVATIRVDP